MASGNTQVVRCATPGLVLEGTSHSQIFIIPGILTNQKKLILAELNIGLDLSSVSRVTFQVFNCGFRTSAGAYILGDNHDYINDAKANITTTINKLVNSISIQISYSEDLYTTNNVPIIAAVTGLNIKMTFS